MSITQQFVNVSLPLAALSDGMSEDQKEILAHMLRTRKQEVNAALVDLFSKYSSEVFGALSLLPEEERQEVLVKAIVSRPAKLLTSREHQVMVRLARGMTNQEIADDLGIGSVKTVDTHRSHVIKKLGLVNNSGITRFAIQHGYAKP